MFDTFKAIGRSVFGAAASKSRAAGIRHWPHVAIVAFALGLVSGSAYAQSPYYNFRSMLSAGGANWCIDVPGSEYKPGSLLAISSCTGAPNQTFLYESGNNLTAGGLCLDGLVQDPNQPPASGDPAALVECSGATPPCQAHKVENILLIA